MKRKRIVIFLTVGIMVLNNNLVFAEANENQIIANVLEPSTELSEDDREEEVIHGWEANLKSINIKVGEKTYFYMSKDKEEDNDTNELVMDIQYNKVSLSERNLSNEDLNSLGLQDKYVICYEIVGVRSGEDKITVSNKNGNIIDSITVNIEEEKEKILEGENEKVEECVGQNKNSRAVGWSEDGLYYTNENGELAKGITKINDQFYHFDKESGMLIKQAGWIDEGEKKYYSNADGVLYVNQFISFGSTKYYMGEDGSVQKGIVKANDGNYYHMDEESGILVKKAGWLEKDGKRCYANAEGRLYRNQFISFGSTKYYMGDDGSVQKGIVKTNDGNYYHMDEESGILVKKAGWLEKDGKRYYANAEGRLYRNQFISFGSTKYYMGEDGSVQKGIVKANDGNYYHMDEESGILVKKAGWLEKDGKRYYANAEGRLYRNQFISFGSQYYYCTGDASIVQGKKYPVKGVLYTFDKNGVMQITPGWGEYNGKKYYINPSTGFPYKGWITFGQTSYYADSNGLLVSGWQKINGYSYYFYPSNYVMARNTTINGKRIGQDGRVAKYSDRMAIFSTVSTNNENGTYNMSRALKSFNQVVIQPGQTLSFFSVAGPCGKAQGYKQAGVVGGVGYGGGICQASTTLYGAAVRAGLTIVQRRNHSVPSTYVPIGQDAMVDYGSSDLKFRNDYDYPVKLVTYVSGRTLYAEVWGMQPGWYDYINVRSWSTGVKSAVAYRDYVKNGKTVKTEQLPSSYYK